MLVERVETVPYALRFREPYITARGTLERREMILLRLQTDNGPQGLGEAVPLSLRGGAGLAEIQEALREAGDRLVGLDLNPGTEDPLAVAVATFLELVRPRKLPPPAAAALECALFDLAAKERDEPLWATLQAESGAPVETNATLTAGSTAALVAQAESWAADGFRTFKLKLGAGDDEAAVAAVRHALGPAARIRVDANEAWEADEAIRVLRALEALDIELAEQPVSGLRAMARVARDVAIPLAADEAVNDEADAHRAVQRRACEFATAKLSKVGGIGTAAAIAAVIPTYLSSALDGPVGIAAAAHGAQIMRKGGADPGIAHGLATQRLFAETVAARECELREGFLHLPEGPGIGVEIDEAELDRCRIDDG
jgi:o-succinylbenzoate synthase